MNWRHVARWGAAAVGLACASALVWFYRPQEPPPPPPVPTGTVDPAATQQGGRGRMIYFSGQRQMNVIYEASRNYDDGRTVFEKPHVIFADARFELWADEITTKGNTNPGAQPTFFNINGNVKFVGKGGLNLQADAATYEDTSGLVTMPGDVTFTRGRLSGRSVGASYFRDEEKVHLADQAVAIIAADERGGGAIELTSKSMVMLGAQHAVHLDGNANIKTGQETLAAENAIVAFTEDEQAMRYLELRGRASVTPLATGKERRSDMRGENITIAFHPDGRALQHATLTGQARLSLIDDRSPRTITGSWIDLYLAEDGKTLTRLDARDRVVVDLPATKELPARIVRGTTLTASGQEGKGLQSARFDGDVSFEEREAAKDARPKVGRSQTLILKLAGELDAVTEAEFQRAVEFSDGASKAQGEFARYDVRTGDLHLLPDGADPKRLSRVESDGFELNGRDVLLSTKDTATAKAQDIKAKGTVTTRMSPRKGGTERKTSTLFDPGRAINGSADEVSYASRSREVLYVGTTAAPAELFQDDNRLVAVRIQLNDDTGYLDARGKVDSTFVTTPTPAAKDKKPGEQPATRTYRITSETLQFDDKRREAVYTGKQAHLKNEEGVIDADRITLTLAAETRTVSTMVATGTLFAKMSEGHELVGDTLTFDATTNRYVVAGAPARAKSRQGDSKTCEIIIAPQIRLDRETNAVDQEGAGRKEVLPGVACDTDIRSKRRP